MTFAIHSSDGKGFGAGMADYPPPYYDQDGITIYHGDCADILPLVEPSTVSLVLTDPPYGINARTNWATAAVGKMRRLEADRPRNRHEWTEKDYPPVVGDDQPFDPSSLLRFGRCVLWGANNFSDRLPAEKCWLVFHRKPNGSTQVPGADLAWTNLGGKVQAFSHLWSGYARESEIGFHVHPTQKPAALMRWVLDGWTQPGDLILDPYMGSGPVAQACHEMGRRYIGVEIVEEYCEIAVRRLAQGVLPL